MCIFIGCWLWSSKGTDTDDVKSMPYHVSELVFLFSCPTWIYQINHLNFYCIKQIDYIFSVRVYCNRSQKTSQRVKNNMSRHSTSSRVVLFLFFTRCDVICDLLKYTHGKTLFVKCIYLYPFPLHCTKAIINILVPNTPNTPNLSFLLCICPHWPTQDETY